LTGQLEKLGTGHFPLGLLIFKGLDVWSISSLPNVAIKGEKTIFV